ncbi:MAG: AEC family transporter [Phaeospirillum sp.]|nr:AEC family transporter [Phaeospirillum sp.]
MDSILQALLPIVALVALGHQMRSRRWVDDGFWLPAERATLFIFFPALLVVSLARAKLTGLPVAGIMAAEGIAVLVLLGVGMVAATRLARPPFHLDGPAFTSLLQCATRPNTYVGLAASAGLWGTEGVALVAICTAMVVPLVNLVFVPIMLRWGRSDTGAAFGWRTTLVPIATNPLIIACLIGIGLNLSGLTLTQPVATLLDILAGASLPLGLLAVGAGLSLRTLRSAGTAVALAIAAKMAALPLLVLIVGRVVGLDGLTLTVCVVYAALPAAPVSYVFARQMGGDAPLVATMLSAQTLAAGVLMPLWIWLVGSGP